MSDASPPVHPDAEAKDAAEAETKGLEHDYPDDIFVDLDETVHPAPGLPGDPAPDLPGEGS